MYSTRFWYVSFFGVADSEGMTGVKGQAVSSEGLILPRKLHNPCLESKDRKDLHRELMLNQKM